jgi:predicted ATPase/class 3 adenylate cyclase
VLPSPGSSLRPVGTVTFLFTDIEGSTRLWEHHPEEMQRALARHDVLLREAIEGNGGYVFKTVGDAFCAAFANAPEALAASVTAQQTLAGEPWPAVTPVRVRMALHTGTAEERDSDYFGPVLNRVARLLSTGHGGQTLVSAATYELIRDSLPKDVRLRDLGQHQLKDLVRAEQVYQIIPADLPEDFPPLKSLNNTPNNLPQQMTSFIGREKEVVAVGEMLAVNRLLTLTGAGGAGKTRLALQVAAEMLDHYPDGVWLVELASLSDPSLIPQTVARAVGIREQAGESIEQTLTDGLRSRNLLLVLDNCEHLLSACAHLVTALLRVCPGLRVLATSREPLGLSGEHVFRVPSLSVPDMSQGQSAAWESMSQFEAVRLFIDRATSVKADFAVNNQNAPALASVCARLDGIPLAIELAAARVRSLTVEDINTKLDQRFRLLTGGSRTALPRQQTLRSLIDWSYDLLNETEKALLCRLSVFAGGWTLEAAEGICAGETVEDWEILDLLTSLSDKSLVIAETSGMNVRYRLLETVRQYAQERLRERGEEAVWRDRHLACFLALAEEAEPQLAGADQQTWLERLATDHDNLRAALEWSGESSTGGGTDGLRLAGALWRFWRVRGHLTEGREYLSRALTVAGTGADAAVRAKAVNQAGYLAWAQGDTASARGFYEAALSLRREIGDRQGIAASLNGLGNVAYNEGNRAAARSLYNESLMIQRELGDQWGIANALNNLGVVAFEQRDFAVARALYEENLAIRRATGDRWGVAVSLNNLGNVAYKQGDIRAARSLYEESLATRRELGDREGVATSLYNLGVMASKQDDFSGAMALYEEALAIWREMGDQRSVAGTLDTIGVVASRQSDAGAARRFHTESLTLWKALDDRKGIATALEGLAAVTAAEGDPEGAACLWGAAEQIREEIAILLPPEEQAEYAQLVEAARTARQDDAAFIAAWAVGKDMPGDQAVARALAPEPGPEADDAL